MKMAKMPARFYLLVAVVVATVAAIGCGGGGGGTSGGSGSSGNPEISLFPDSISFGNVVVGQAADRSVDIQNVGTTNLVIGAAAASPAQFSVVAGKDTCSNQTILPNEYCSLVVRFTPSEAAADPVAGSLVIPSNAPDETIALSGYGKGLNVTINWVDTSAVGTTNIVQMIVSVTDWSNNPVPLADSAFTVYEGSATMPLIIKSPPGTSVSAVLDLDYSYSVAAVQDAVRDSAKGFINQLGAWGASDEAAVIKFAVDLDFAADFTNDKNDLISKIDLPYTGDPLGTRVYDAVYESIIMLASRNERRCAIVVSDGEDISFSGAGSDKTLNEVIANASDNGVLLFTIGFGNPIITQVMQRMAVETGGLYFDAPDGPGLDAVYSQISAILNAQYLITFTTSQTVGTTNSLRVVVDNGTGATGDATKSVDY
jgi:VWFA-related protein